MTKRHDRSRSLAILESCLNLESEQEKEAMRQNRLDELIADFTSTSESQSATLEYASGWHFCVPTSFRSALDIKLTQRVVDRKATMQWTQGSWFHFQAGDTLYDSAKAYLPWDLANFRICLDVRQATSAIPPNGKDRPSRYPGSIIFDVLTPDAQRKKLVKRRETTMSQDAFVKLLIEGPPEDWQHFLIEVD